MEKPKPNYYAIIPASIRYNKKLPLGAKLMYGEITALSNKEGYCWASNKYFSELYGVNINTIGRWIKKLKDAGYIKVYVIQVHNGRERKMYINDSLPTLVN